MSVNIKPTKRELAQDLHPFVEQAKAVSHELGLEPFPVDFWVVDYEEMNQLIAYNGYTTRYPHWRWGMNYERQKRSNQYGLSRAFEIVTPDNPCNAFLQESNSLIQQEAVIAHVLGHADFFAKNRTYKDIVGSTRTLARNARRVSQIIEREDVTREEVERWIDHILCIEDVIDQHFPNGRSNEYEPSDIREQVQNLGISPHIVEEVFTEDWFENRDDPERLGDPKHDLLFTLLQFGQQYDEENERAIEYEDWQVEVLEIIRDEAYIFAPLKMTKVMNEGWAAYWESLMMTAEQLAKTDEYVDYASHMSLILGSPGLNPYKLGITVWKYIENKTNRQEVVSKLLRTDGITSKTFHHDVDCRDIIRKISQQVNSDDIVERNYSLCRPENKTFLGKISRDELEDIERYIMDDNRYETVDAAIRDIQFSAGWDRMFEVRETKNDVGFLDEYLTEEYIKEEKYFSFAPDNRGRNIVDSVDPYAVKQKILRRFTNFGKPVIVVEDLNHANTGELRLTHQYDGIPLDTSKAQGTLKRLFNLWGRPVSIRTIGWDKDGEETGRVLTYDGETTQIKELSWKEVSDIVDGRGPLYDFELS